MTDTLSLLEVPAVRDRVKPWSVEEYHLLGEAGLLSTNVELLEGVIVEKMSKTSLHSAAVQRLARLLRATSGAAWEVRQEQPITTIRSEPEPDLAVVPFREDDYSGGHPTAAPLVIEVAVSSVDIDHQKRAIYAAAGVPEYWIVLPEEQRVEVYTQPIGRDYAERREFAPPEVLASELLPAFRLDLAMFFPG